MGSAASGDAITITATDGTHTTPPVTTTSDGDWSVAGNAQRPSLNDGTITYLATATDSAGNTGVSVLQGTKETAVAVALDKRAPP